MIEETVHSHRNDISKKRKEVQSSRPDSCPECGDRKICKDGLRKLSNGETTQRWLCKNCAHRFSDTKSLIREAKIPLKDRSKQTLINTSNVTIERQVGKFLTLDLDNLAAVKPLKEGLAGATKQTADIKGKIVEFLWHLKKNGYSSSTITLYNTWLLTLTRLGVDLKNPEGVKEIIALHDRWSTSTKSNVVAAYKSFADFLGLRWTPPK